jgi:Domain of unknown function (DUF1918)
VAFRPFTAGEQALTLDLPPYVVRWHDGSKSLFFPASADTLTGHGPRR